ncbi:MAG: 5-histidylcysteine sulfoxide synthase [Pseudomonadales bacterium]|nr:5-histidylcysteine sulfoxide synthase [Pseudomonadales bacterium]
MTALTAISTTLSTDLLNKRSTTPPLLSGDCIQAKRDQIREYFNQTFALYESLFEIIATDEAYFQRPEPLRHPLIFYFGHTATFFINKLIVGKIIDQRINEKFESIFAIGVDEMSWDDLDERHYDWPTVNAVREYRSQVKVLVNDLISNMPLTLPIRDDSVAWVLLMGIEHERIHLETSSVIIRLLPLDSVSSHPLWEPCLDSGTAPDNKLLPITGRKIQLGKPENVETYGWDNEYGRRELAVESFSCAQYLVSNQEFLKFVDAGGYHELRYWTEEGRQWLSYSKAGMPHFWLKKEGQYWQRNLYNEIPLPLNWPVEVNFLEAKAFCNWKAEEAGSAIRLPTEAEWMVLREKLDADITDWEVAPGNLNLEEYASSCPVDRHQVNGFFDIVGNVWQWTETPIDGYTGFQVHELYDDFSTPTFDGKHNLFKGGSWISTGNEASKHSRYAFRRHFFQHAGFRYIESQTEVLPVDKVNIYETDDLVSQYLEFHYGANYFEVSNYPKSCIRACMDYTDELPKHRALDLGCSVGRSTFELARYFEHVDGIDFSARFIQQGVQLKEEGAVRYTIPTEGELVEFKETSLSALEYNSIKDKVHFSQGDACNLKTQFSRYNLIFCGNLIDRLYDPVSFLQMIGDRLEDQGYLVLTSPYTWLEEYTEKTKWLGGHKVNGENYTTLDGLKENLSPRFELVDVCDIPFVIRETQRKYQHTIAQMSVWLKSAATDIE